MRMLIALAVGTMLTTASIAPAQTIVMRRHLSNMPKYGPGSPDPVQESGGTTPTPTPTPTPAPAPSPSPAVADWVQGGLVVDAPSCSATAPAHRTMTCQTADGTTVPDASCSGSKPVVTGTVEDYSGCSYFWKSGDWSVWSSTCSAKSERTRTVECVRSDGQPALRPGLCEGAYPSTSEVVPNYTDCTGVLINGDFETGTMDGWTGGSIAPNTKSGGSAALLANSKPISQTIATKAISYTLTFSCASTGGSAIRAMWNGVQVALCRGANTGDIAWSKTPTTANVKGTGGNDVLSFAVSTSSRLIDDVVLSPAP